MNWNLWSKQIDAIVRLELKRSLKARKWIGVYLVAFAPVILLLVRVFRIRRVPDLAELSSTYAGIYSLFILRFGIFLSCATIFGQLFRGEILEKTLHFYLLAPVRREIIAIGKYLGALVISVVVFSICTVATFILFYYPSPEFGAFLFRGQGISFLARYLAVALMACAGYGSVFLSISLMFKNPGAVTGLLLGWESFSFALPPILQRFTLTYYLQPLLPVTVDRGLFFITTEPASAFLSIPGLLVVIAGILLVAGRQLRRVEVTYSAD